MCHPPPLFYKSRIVYATYFVVAAQSCTSVYIPLRLLELLASSMLHRLCFITRRYTSLSFGRVPLCTLPLFILSSSVLKLSSSLNSIKKALAFVLLAVKRNKNHTYLYQKMDIWQGVIPWKGYFMKKIIPEYSFTEEQLNIIGGLSRVTGLTENVTNIL